MKTLYTINLFIHALAGAISLITVVLPVVTKKGGWLHRRAGWIFTVTMAVVSITGLVLATFWLAIPLTVQPASDVTDIEKIARHAKSVRLTAPFFILLSFITGYAVWGGISTLRPTRNVPVAVTFLLCMLGSGAVVLTVGIMYQQIVFMIFGAFGIYSAVTDLWTINAERPTGKERIIEHLKAMLGGATAAFTAFTVQVAGRMTDSAGLSVVLWIGPLVLGLLTTQVFTRRLRRMKPAA